ncbi:hypothetical protein LPTSP4_35860 [Leptospira ryugenii]|uniref:Uncharacterized protein n=1 Tax=Leptospira ryugenii TaxID=1917863 RepID=A0A2P2E597_9LEPT|nr:hypothetical protein LPTSP4_35860 [Leptospira ryugenii]
MTANALGARKNLNENGWFIVPPGSKSVDVVYESGRLSAKVARAIVFSDMKDRTLKLPDNMKETVSAIHTISKTYRNFGKESSAKIWEATLQLSKQEYDISKDILKESGSRFVLGYLYLGEKESEDRNRLLKVWSETNESRKEFTGSLNQLFVDTIWKNKNQLTNAWTKSFQTAVKEFSEEYEESGNRETSVTALFDIFQGYTVFLKEFLVTPIFQTGKSVGETMLVNGVYVPIAQTATFSGEAVMTTGLVVYYPFQLGYRVVSPSLESGFLASIGLATLSSTAPTLVTGTSIAGFNQVTTVTTGYAGEAIGQTGAIGFQSTAYVTGLVYDFSKGVGESSLYALKSGIILSYTSLTVIPAHLLLTVPDGTVFLTYDGPRLVIAAVRGNYAGYDDLPTGTIVDLERAKKEGKVQILTSDQAIVKKVIAAEIKEREEELKRKTKDTNK